MNQYGVLAVLVAILIGLATPAIAAPLTLADLDATTEAVVQLEDVGSGMWELSFIANTEIVGLTVGIVDRANVSSLMFLGRAANGFSFTNHWSDVARTQFLISAFSGTAPDPSGTGLIVFPFAANTAYRIASFQYANGAPRFDNAPVAADFGHLLLKPDFRGIDLARVEFGVVPKPFIDNITSQPMPEPSSWLLLSLGIAGMVMLRRKLASRA